MREYSSWLTEDVKGKAEERDNVNREAKEQECISEKREFEGEKEGMAVVCTCCEFLSRVRGAGFVDVLPSFQFCRTVITLCLSGMSGLISNLPVCL